MQIVYVSAMVAIFVLCLALLSTARRILHSTPLTSGQLSISTNYDLEGPQAETLARVNEAENFAPVVQAAYSDPDPDFAEPALSQATAVEPASQFVPAKPIEARPLFATPLPSIVQAPTPIAAPKKVANLLPARKAIRMRKPSRRVYNYAFECLLLGVSALVLIKTQRGVMRYRGSHPSVA